MDTDQLRNHIQQWVKRNKVLISPLGEIHLGDKLGEGGTGLVYASDFLGGSAVKLLAEEITNPPSNRLKRFLDEYRNLVKLVRTDKVVALYDYGEVDIGGARVPYILMERCQSTLDNRFRNPRLQTAEEFADVLNQLLEALEVVHGSGMVHRDIKPKNILVRANGKLVLADFGIAWFDPEQFDKLAKTEKGDRLANFDFSAPEQSKHDVLVKPTPNMDLYALGQTLYFCVTGETIRGTNHKPLSSYSPALGKYDPLITRLIQHVPSTRFQSVAEVRQYLADQTPPKELTDWERDERWFYEMEEQVDEFDKRLQRPILGWDKYKLVTKQDDINALLAALAEDNRAYNLWWRKGRWVPNHLELLGTDMIFDNEDMYFHTGEFRQLDANLWLIAQYECIVGDLCIHRHTRHAREYVVLHLLPQKPFGIYDLTHEHDVETVALCSGGRYIHIDLYMQPDTFVKVDGEVIDTTECQVRRRNLKDDFIFLAPGQSMLFSDKAADTFANVCRQLHLTGRISGEILRPLDAIPLDWRMTLLD